MNCNTCTDSKFSTFCKQTMNTEADSAIVHQWINSPDAVKRALAKMILEAGEACL